jgi:hypothetical protein
MTPDISIIVVNWNTRDLLDDCLGSLPAALDGLHAEVILVDNASRDGSAEHVRRAFPAVTVIEAGANLGFARANNLALPRAVGDAVLLLNPDTVCRPGSLARLHRELAALPAAGAVGPLLLDARGAPTMSYGNEPSPLYHLLGLLGPHDRRWPRALRRATFARIPAADDPGRAVDYVVGACLLIRRSCLEAVGGLDERFFMYFEETDWCRRARAAGWEIRYCAEARVAHLEGRAAARAGDFALAQFQHSYRLYVTKQDGPARVPLYRAVLLLEYAVKGVWRRLLAAVDRRGRARHAALADDFLRIAALQLRADVAPTPPR